MFEEVKKEPFVHGIDVLMEGQMSGAQKAIADEVVADYREGDASDWAQKLRDASPPKAATITLPTVYPFDFESEEVVTLYLALDTYLKVLVQQPALDLQAIERTAKLMIAIKPSALKVTEASAKKEKDAN